MFFYAELFLIFGEKVRILCYSLIDPDNNS